MTTSSILIFGSLTLTPSNALGPLARRDGDAVFDEAWQAQALAMADCLVRAEVFTGTEWAEALGVAVREQPDTTEGLSLIHI